LTFKKKKKNKKKKGHSYCITWDSDASSSDDEKKAIASIAINKKPSLFDTPSTCFVAKATMVQSDNESVWLQMYQERH
jgi:hypothetical protein